MQVDMPNSIKPSNAAVRYLKRHVRKPAGAVYPVLYISRLKWRYLNDGSMEIELFLSPRIVAIAFLGRSFLPQLVVL
jgi:hypothetical protein